MAADLEDKAAQCEGIDCDNETDGLPTPPVLNIAGWLPVARAASRPGASGSVHNLNSWRAVGSRGPAALRDTSPFLADCGPSCE